MSREVKRVALDFDWPIGKVWWGCLLPPVECQLCNGAGTRPTPGTLSAPYGHTSDYCDVCDGEGNISPTIAIPEFHDGGGGWQMWETTSEGSPISPVFVTPEALAQWLADTGASAFGSQTATREEWLRMIGVGSCPSFAIDNGAIKSGVEVAADMTKNDEDAE